MAAGRLKSLRLPPDKTGDHCDYEETQVNFPKMSNSKSIDRISNRSFSIFDGFLITFSLVTYLVDIITGLFCLQSFYCFEANVRVSHIAGTAQ